MKSIFNLHLSGFILRIAIAVPYIWFVADRAGLLGPHGGPHTSWGDWPHFQQYAATVLSFVPAAWVYPLALLASITEGILGILLLLGAFTRLAAAGSALLSLSFALSMAVSFGIESPLAYSVFTVAAASMVLAGLPAGKWSIDQLINK
ncbi:TQO small subunit DoxD [Chitinophaga solisilvae]|uniref:DoxX family membrane protein n=1 Tax=Chitinophaga solisilvae TaxID=1233460 RepID=A0A3S1CU04_9BACT|nr:TQO small subunit DoxD [Chitinophaga solisilvae]NSL86984.1 DoxX family membrane protein [Chitinophaga solisilvae]